MRRRRERRCSLALSRRGRRWRITRLPRNSTRTRRSLLKGTITKMEWINPHSWIHVEVKNPDGTVTEWMVEGGTPNTLFRRGFTRDAVKAGMEITVEGYRAKNGANRANGRDLILADGRRLFMGSSGTGAPIDGRDDSDKK